MEAKGECTYLKSQPVRKFSKLPNRSLLNKRNKYRLCSLDQSTIEAYSVKTSFLSNLLIEKKKINNKKCSSGLSPKSNVPSKYFSPKVLSQRFSKKNNSIKGAEEKLEFLINAYFDERKNFTDPRFKDKKISVNIAYQKLDEFGRKEIANYQSDIEKNLKVEKMKLKGDRKLLERIQNILE